MAAAHDERHSHHEDHEGREGFGWFTLEALRTEAKLRMNNPDESERTRDLWSMVLMEGAFHPLDGQLSVEGVWRILEEHQDAGVLSKSIARKDVEEMVRQELVQEAWQELSQTDEVKRNLERLQPVIERLGY